MQAQFPTSTQPLSQPVSNGTHNLSVSLTASLALVAIGALVTSVGLAKVFLREENAPLGDAGTALTTAGLVVSALGGYWTLKLIQTLPLDGDDCDRYGRHMVGLTFVLLTIGLCNAVGTSVLAWNGGVGFSAHALIEASDEKNVEKANAELKTAQDASKAALRSVALAKADLAKSQQGVARLCGASQGEDTKECMTARASSSDQEAAVAKVDLEAKDAEDAVTACKTTCAETHRKANQALFFLLSISTITSLFGASFYVVNRVRGKRPRMPTTGSDIWDVDSSTRDGDGKPSSGTGGAAAAKSSTTTGSPRAGANNAPAQGAALASKTPDTEPFDAYAFWSGAFFRVGEAVLFTFAFFWLLWTQGNRERVVWLPVIGLFVGMFVKTGEAIIFRLGMRVLFAVEAFFPMAAESPPGNGAAARSSPDGGPVAPGGTARQVGAGGGAEAAPPQAPATA